MNAQRFAVVDKQNTVVNVIEADEDFSIEGFVLIKDADHAAEIGGVWTGSLFLPAKEQPVEPLSPIDKKLADLQDAVDTLTMQLLSMGTTT